MAANPLLLVALRLLPAPLRAQVTPARLAVLEDFIRFGCVGLAGFVVDVTTVYAARGSLGLYGGGVLAYLTAATTTWALNRVWTFRGRGSGSAHRQWALFLLVNAMGFVLNRGTYAALITWVPLCAERPELAILGGVSIGMWSNFFLSRRIVFR